MEKQETTTSLLPASVPQAQVSGRPNENEACSRRVLEGGSALRLPLRLRSVSAQGEVSLL